MEVTLFVIDLVLAFAPFMVLALVPNRREGRPVAPHRRSTSGLAASRRARKKVVPEAAGNPLLPPPAGVGGGTAATVRLRPTRRPTRPRFRRDPGRHTRGPR